MKVRDSVYQFLGVNPPTKKKESFPSQKVVQEKKDPALNPARTEIENILFMMIQDKEITPRERCRIAEQNPYLWTDQKVKEFISHANSILKDIDSVSQDKDMQRLKKFKQTFSKYEHN